MSELTIKTKLNNEIIISGDVAKILHNRRAVRILKDSLRYNFSDGEIWVSEVQDFQSCLDIISHVAKLTECNLVYSESTNKEVEHYKSEEEKFAIFSKKALTIRDNQCDIGELRAFKDVLLERLPNRTLYDLQMLSAYHLAFSQNACNFSVPGAGKTSVVYGAYAYLKSLSETDSKKVDKLLIIGPLSSFAPWELEYEECFGRKPVAKRLVGKMPLEEKKQYLYEQETAELILVSYASVAALAEELAYFLNSNRVMLVLDEAHKIKNTQGGIVAQSALGIAQLGEARVVLTGTPAPNGYEDLYNLFKFIWPSKKIIRFHINQLRDMSKQQDDPRVGTLINQISPYFIRVKKSDLGIPPATTHPPIIVPMSDRQRLIYDFIERKYINEITNTNEKLFRDNLINARLIRLMQAATNPQLLKQPLQDFAEIEGIDLSGIVEDAEIIKTILDYQIDESPNKFVVARDLIKPIIQNGGKVIIWACYIRTIDGLSEYLLREGINNRILYGATPIASSEMTPEQEEYEFTREAIVKTFNDKDSDLKVIIANPFAVAESISLHKACHNAIYLERSFNAAHFIQSKDRIHRYGLKKDTVTNYYFLVSENSIDTVINDRLEIKERRLMEIMEDMPIPLFDNVLENEGDEDVKAVLRDYARRIKTV
ncbi:MAG: DEAD/DEAH box helicase [Firmicutes bacterium]|nr:DEAD/DEAH box helicase [Bacillota bacterium]